LQHAEQLGRRVAVGVVRSDRDQRHASSGGGEEVRVGIRAAVVRHLEHVRSQVGTAGEDACLGVRAQVSREQHPKPPVRDTHDERQVVRLGVGGGLVRGRRKHLQNGAAHGPAVPRDQDCPLRLGAAHCAVERRRPLVGRRQRAGRYQADVPPVQSARQPGHVVGVQVREDDQRQGIDPQPVEAAVDRADVRAGVDEDPLPRRRGHDEGIALAHVAGHDQCVRRRPAA
jgi:hypothetical protein